MNAWQEPIEAQFYDAETTERLKTLFAYALCRHVNPYDAAREIEPNGLEGRAHWIVANWLDDPFVVQTKMAYVLDSGPAIAGLPSKEELALKIYKEADMVQDKTTKLAYLRAVADVMGYIARGGGTNVNVNNTIVNQPKIQKVPVYSSEDEWEQDAKLIQAKIANK